MAWRSWGFGGFALGRSGYPSSTDGGLALTMRESEK